MRERDQTPAEEQAASWFTRLQTRSVSTADLAEFAVWRRDPANADAYRRVEAVWSESGRLGADPDIQAALGDARSRSGRGHHMPTARRWLPMVAAALLVLTIGSYLILPIMNAPTFRTGVGERSETLLVDGTRLHLDTDSVVTTRFGEGERLVRLQKGQVFLDVFHDPSRPLVVEAGEGVRVKALGTRFDVMQLDEAVRVSLVQGSVEVRRSDQHIATLLPGQVVQIGASGPAIFLKQTAVDGTSWRTGRLSFDATPLRDAVRDMNRYTDKPVVISDTVDPSQRVSGEFSTADVDGFVKALDALLGAGTVKRQGSSS